MTERLICYLDLVRNVRIHNDKIKNAKSAIKASMLSSSTTSKPKSCITLANEAKQQLQNSTFREILSPSPSSSVLSSGTISRTTPTTSPLGQYSSFEHSFVMKHKSERLSSIKSEYSVSTMKKRAHDLQAVSKRISKFKPDRTIFQPQSNKLPNKVP
ncbi:hypothetical protein RCL1_002460 [Eukaryota sp. TZLM3-RCL]